MSLVHRLRIASGCNQAEFAARAGTSRPRVSAYERGHTDPGLDTLERLAAAAGQEIDLAHAGTREVRDRVAAIGAAVAEDDPAFALRLAADLTERARSGRVSIAAFVVDPGSTGDRRWDSLIGGIAECLAHENSQPVPPWSAAPGRTLDTPWFVSSRHSTRPVVLRETPAPLAARNVFVTAASLRSV